MFAIVFEEPIKLQKSLLHPRVEVKQPTHSVDDIIDWCTRMHSARTTSVPVVTSPYCPKPKVMSPSQETLVNSIGPTSVNRCV